MRVTDHSKQTFQIIFTSPSSARGNLDAEPAPATREKLKMLPSKRPHVAAQLRMDGQVTARAIAYAAVQVRRVTRFAVLSCLHSAPSCIFPSVMLLIG